MQTIWMTTAEVRLEPEDASPGYNHGFMRICVWAESEEEFLKKLKDYLESYQWFLMGVEMTHEADLTRDHGDEINQMIDETQQDRNAIRLGTFYSYPVN
jgi:hypothetical protein